MDVRTSGNTETGRIALLLSREKRNMGRQNLAKAQAYYGAGPCVPCVRQQPVLQATVPAASALLDKNVTACLILNRIIGVEGCIPESLRIARLQQANVDASRDPMNPDTRFSAYKRPIPPPICPPIPQNLLNASTGYSQGLRCQPPRQSGVSLPG